MALDLDLADDVVNRPENGEHHPAENDAEDHRQRRLDDHLNLTDRFAHFPVVEVGHVEQRLVERAGRLAHPQHSHDERREKPHLLERSGDVLALADLLSRESQALLDDHVAGDFLRVADRIEDGDPRGVHESENAGEARQDDLAQDLARHRESELEAIELVTHRGVGPSRQLDADEHDCRGGQESPPVAYEKRRDLDQDARLQRNLLPHVPDEGDHLRYEVDHQEESHHYHDRTDERGIEDELLHVLRQLVFPFQVLDEAFQHLGELSRVLTGANQARKPRVEDLRILGEALRQPQAPLDALDDSRHYFAKSGIFDAVAQVDQRLDERPPGSDELLHVEAEVDELRTLDFARTKQAPAVTGRSAPHQVKAHALQAQLEVDQIDRFDLAEHRLSPGIYGLVGKECHV